MNEDKAREAFEACPFCGKTHTLKLTSAQELAQEGDDDPELWEHSDSYAVICDASRPHGPGGCGAAGGFMPTEADAIATWNRRAALQWAASQQAAEGWRPIESAPVSGRGERPAWFLAFNGHHIGVCARWGDEGYGEVIADEGDEVVTPPPTHWRPLPAPPSTQGGADADQA